VAQDFLLELVQSKLDAFCDQKREELTSISEDLIPLIDYTQALLSGASDSERCSATGRSPPSTLAQ